VRIYEKNKTDFDMLLKK